MFGPKMHVMEAPLLGAAIGGLIGGGGTLAGFATLGGMAGMALGAVGGSLLGKSMKTPKMPQDQSAAAAAETPALPPATEMPAAPATPTATPTPQAVGEVSTPTAEELAAGQINTEKKRKGRLSTILTTPKSRLIDSGTETEGMERLGG